MPFIPDSVRKLRNHLRLSQFGFAKELTSVMDELAVQGLYKYKTRVTPQTIYNWEKGLTDPHFGVIDPLFLMTARAGLKLAFYKYYDGRGMPTEKDYEMFQPDNYNRLTP